MIKFRGMNVTTPVNRLEAGFCAVAANVRAYLDSGFALRNPLTAAVISSLPTPIHSIKRLNDSTPNGPPGGYSLVIGASTSLYLWNPTVGLVRVATGLSGNPLSMIPFRPNTSVQPWMYVADYSAQGSVTLATEYLINGDAVNFVTNGMMKVSYGNGYTAIPTPTAICWKMGIKEPQEAPIISTTNTNAPFGEGVGNLLATTIPWTNYNGVNTGYNYGETYGPPNPGSPNPVDGTAPFVVNCQNANFITITSLTGSATINGGTKTPTSSGPVANTYPAYFIQAIGTGVTPPASATVVTGAFTDGAGNVVLMGVAPLFIPSVVDVGAVIGVANGIKVPFGAVAFQIGIDSSGNTFNSNSGAFSLAGYVTTNALPTVTSILGTLTAYYWGDSPSLGPNAPLGSYIWKNPDDSGGSGPTRSISDAIGSTTGNSFIFDATFVSGIPELPGVGTADLPMEWTILNPQSTAIGTNPVFAAPITTPYTGNTSFDNFNFCLQGNIYFPSSGHYTFVLTSHDDTIWGIGGGVTLVSATESGSGEGSGVALSGFGQTITVVGGYPLLPREVYTSGSGGDYAETTVVVNVPAAGIYPIEIDYDYWARSGRILLLMASPVAGPGSGPSTPTIIPPLPSSVRQNTQYRGVYRSSATGATSNPSPASAIETIPVTANTISLPYSNDPQVDVCDYYRIDSVTADYVYVNTGPNDGLGGTIGGVVYNTPVTDSLTDTELGDQLLNEDNFEPFPSIDLPQKGTCNVSGGVVTWVSGGAIGGTTTGFNVRWLAGTTILIGYPTSLAYEAVRRPTNGTTWDFTGADPEVPDATGVTYEIEQPVLAAQPLPYMWGPTDNINFTFAVGDQLRPGTLYWCAGSNLDAAPDTNQLDVTDPAEPLINGAMSGGRGVLASIKRFWVIMPNFFNAEATTTGTQGSTWTLQETSISRGLFIPRCIAVSGGGNVFFRVDDGIHLSPEGAASQSISDATLYPLFSHEGSTPQPVTRNGITVYPPDDTKPQLQKFSYQNAFLYYTFQGTDGNQHVLVFDEAAMGWIWDTPTPTPTIYAPDEGESTQGVLVGCIDGTIRQIGETGETVTGTVLTPALGVKGWGHCGELQLEYSSQQTVTLTGVVEDSENGSYAPLPITLPATGGKATKYFTRPSANKWKLLSWQWQSTDPALQVYCDGCVAYLRSWGSAGPYEPTQMFAPNGGLG